MDSIALPVNLVILGSTGSIGTQALDIARAHPDKVRIRALAAGSNADLMAKQAAEFKPDLVAMADKEAAARLKGELECPVLSGPGGVEEVAAHDPADCVITAMVGAAGLVPTLTALRKGRRIGLANKETMVVAGDIINAVASAHKADVVPVDSEHSAIYQCLSGESPSGIRKLVLTASGGPFRNRPLNSFESISREEALNHPNWEMGPKITIDSATMMNKGLEVIEARWLFKIPADRIEVVIHPQSIIHSMVEFVDGSSKAQLGPPDMKVPIQYALSAPMRWEADHPVIDWREDQTLTFNRPDPVRYPCLQLAFEALRMGEGAGSVLNAANEAAVSLFLDGRVPYVRIASLIEGAMQAVDSTGCETIEARLAVDREARSWVMQQIR
jgi:1-deoxy-D-xylulose-5-phosphate reductoisomerase